MYLSSNKKKHLIVRESISGEFLWVMTNWEIYRNYFKFEKPIQRLFVLLEDSRPEKQANIEMGLERYGNNKENNITRVLWNPKNTCKFRRVTSAAPKLRLKKSEMFNTGEYCARNIYNKLSLKTDKEKKHIKRPWLSENILDVVEINNRLMLGFQKNAQNCVSILNNSVYFSWVNNIQTISKPKDIVLRRNEVINILTKKIENYRKVDKNFAINEKKLNSGGLCKLDCLNVVRIQKEISEFKPNKLEGIELNNILNIYNTSLEIIPEVLTKVGKIG